MLSRDGRISLMLQYFGGLGLNLFSIRNVRNFSVHLNKWFWCKWKLYDQPQYLLADGQYFDGNEYFRHSFWLYVLIARDSPHLQRFGVKGPYRDITLQCKAPRFYQYSSVGGGQWCSDCVDGQGWQVHPDLSSTHKMHVDEISNMCTHVRDLTYMHFIGHLPSCALCTLWWLKNVPNED